MKKLLILSMIVMTACQYQSKDEMVRPNRPVKVLQQQALADLLDALNINGPHELISVEYFNDSLRMYANIYFRNTQTGLERNIIIQKADALEELGKTYVCLGNCPCYVRPVMEADGTWGAQCTCADCLLSIFNIAASQAFFN